MIENNQVILDLDREREKIEAEIYSHMKVGK
jgi:hypothetical protein